ncbi:MAG: hypothetical protein LN413_05075 [Candidatus Thermoplasmatota archaeon]|nr:hypothetical protein [Candidatus Thermoplasmatota archaeon]
MLVTGIGSLAVGFMLALYSVPSEVPALPSFPFFSLPFPLLSLLIALGSAFLAMGWIFHSQGSLSKLLVLSATLVAAGTVWAVISFATSIPLEFGGTTIYFEPYAAHASLLLVTGLLLAAFGLLFRLLDRWEERREKRLAEETQLPTQD